MKLTASEESCIQELNSAIALMSSWADRIKTDLSDYNYDTEKTAQAKEYHMRVESMLNGAVNLKDEIVAGVRSVSHHEIGNYKMFAERQRADYPEGVLIKPSPGYRKYLLRVL